MKGCKQCCIISEYILHSIFTILPSTSPTQVGAKESGNPPLSENSRGGPVERMRVCRPHRQVCGAAGLTIAVLYRSERQIVLVLGYDGHEGSGGVAGRTDGRTEGRAVRIRRPWCVRVRPFARSFGSFVGRSCQESSKSKTEGERASPS